MRVIKRSFLFPAVLLAVLLAGPAASAHQSPEGCAGTEPQVSFSASTLAQLESPVRPGDQVMLGARVSNKGKSACDLSDLSIQVQVPKPDGNPGETFIMASGLNLTAGAAVEGFEEAASYLVDLNSDVSQASITMSWSATVHQGSEDAQIGGGAIQAKLTVTRPQATLSLIPDRTEGPPPLTVRYRYELKNVSPGGEAGLPSPGLVSNGVGDSTDVISDPNCSPVTFVSSSGDPLAETTLDPGETWTFTCSRTFLLPGTYSSHPSIIGISNSDGRPWPQIPTVAQVTVLGADLTVDKSHQEDLLAGRAGKYRISVTNGGNQGTAGPVTVADQLPAGLTATALSGDGWSCSLRKLGCRRSDPLAPGGSYPDVTLSVRAATDPPSDVINAATVSGGGEPSAASANNRDEDPTRIRIPGQPSPPVIRKLRIKKVVTANNGTATLKVLVPGPGRLKVDDARKPDLLRRSSRKVPKSRTYRIVVKAGPRLRRQLMRTGKPRKVRVKVTFNSDSLATLIATRRVQFRLG